MVRRIKPRYSSDEDRCSICNGEEDLIVVAATTDPNLYCCEVCYRQAAQSGFDNLLVYFADLHESRARWLRELIGKLTVESD
jgi:hypothetical protein